MMLRFIFFVLLIHLTTGCASFWGMFSRHDEVKPPPEAAPVQVDNSPKRTTRKSLEEESMLGEDSGSLWVGRGQASYLFTNNNFRIIGDIVNVKLEGYPIEQIQTKANVISKLLAEILNEQRQEIKLKQDELKKQLDPEQQNKQKDDGANILIRGLAAIGSNPTEEKKGPTVQELESDLKKSEKDLEKIGKEEQEIKDLQKQREFPIKSVVARIVEIQRDGNYKIKSETPFLIGKREYKLLVMGVIRREEFEEKGISAEILVDPTFDIISEKKSEAL